MRLFPICRGNEISGMMVALRLFLRLVTFAIYLVLAVIVLWFPTYEFLARFALEMRLFRFWNSLPYFPVTDALFPCLVLALLYVAVMIVRRKIEAVDLPEEHGDRREIDNVSRERSEHK